METGDFIGFEGDLSEAFLYQPYPASCKLPKSHTALALLNFVALLHGTTRKEHSKEEPVYLNVDDYAAITLMESFITVILRRTKLL